MNQIPKWLFNKSTHQIPIGGALEFYCQNNLTRPRKDNWDDDSEDEIISAYCTHNGDISIPMNPGGLAYVLLIHTVLFIYLYSTHTSKELCSKMALGEVGMSLP